MIFLEHVLYVMNVLTIIPDLDELAMERNVRNAGCIDAVEDVGARVAWLESEGCATLRRSRHVCRYWNGVPINSRNSRDDSSREELFFS